MLPDAVVNSLAQRAGFGANLRNTHRVRLLLFAKYLLEEAENTRVNPPTKEGDHSSPATPGVS